MPFNAFIQQDFSGDFIATFESWQRTLGRRWPDLRQWTHQKSTPRHTNPYPTWHDSWCSFPMFVTLLFTLFAFPHHFTVPNHMSILGYFSSTSNITHTTGSLYLLLFQEPYPQRIGCLALLFHSNLSDQFALLKRSISPTLCKKKMHNPDNLFLDLSNIIF